MRTIFHLDLDAFFVSVERILDPSLEGKPVIVGGSPKGRGVVAACSYEARKFGLHSAMPIRTAYQLCPDGIYIKGHYEEYVSFSKAVKNILKRYAPVIEQASIDEFYMDFTGCRKIYGSPIMFAAHLHKEILRETSLPCSIGIAGNKNVAKIASDFRKPKGVTCVLPGCEKEFLADLAIERMPGIGKVTARELNLRGFYFIKDIAAMPKEYFSIKYGKYGSDLWRKANGEGTKYLTVEHEQKQISKETTFKEDITGKDQIKKILFDLTGKVVQNLRDHGWNAATINIKLRYSDFKTLTRSRTIKPSSDDKIIFSTAWELMDKAITRRIAIRLVGIGVSNFSPFSEQEELFEDESNKRKKLFQAVDFLRHKYDYDIIGFK